MVYLLDRMARAAGESGTVTFLSSWGNDERVGWGELYSDAVRVAAGLQAGGVGPGRSVVVLGLTSRPVVTAAMAVWLAGGALTMAPTPSRTMDLAGFVAETRRRIDRLGDPLVVVGPPFEETLPGLSTGNRRVVPLDEVLAARPAAPWTRPPLTADDPAILQLTSGTTGSAKTVRISHANLAANVEAIKSVTGHSQVHGRILSWLPLSHDMGLIGTLVMPMSCGRCDVVLSSPVDYLARPAEWMRQVSRHRATGTVGPASAYALAARLLAAGPKLDLSSLRCALCGGEQIDPDIMGAFTDAAAAHGMDRGAVLPAYGLAESVVAVTLSPFGGGLRVDTVDADVLERDRRAVPVHTDGVRTRRLTRLGPPVAGMKVRVTDPDSGRPLADRQIGEVQVTGTSLTTGYHGDPAATAATRTPDGWLRTGDLGYLVDGELVITGRAKDVIVIAGRNIYPDEVERAAARAEGVRPGNAVAFACPRPGALGSEGLVVAVETRWPDRHDALRAAVADQVRAALGISPYEVVVLAPGTLPKTPSGKLQRAEARRLLAPGAAGRAVPYSPHSTAANAEPVKI